MLSEAAPTDHNLAVLKRQDPHIQRVILTAGHSAVYAYSEEDDNWERHKVEGAFFIVERDLHPLWRFVILNRLNTDNLVEDITADFVVEESDQVHPWGAARGRCLFRESWGASLPRCACTAAVPPLQKCRAQGARPLVLPGSRPRTRAGADRRVSGRSVAGNRSVVPPRLPHAKFSPPPPLSVGAGLWPEHRAGRGRLQTAIPHAAPRPQALLQNLQTRTATPPWRPSSRQPRRWGPVQLPPARGLACLCA